MKNIVWLIKLLTGTLLSCKKSFIEIAPESSVSVDILYKTDKDFQDAINGGYNVLQTQYPNMWVFGDLPADDVSEDIPNHFDHVTFDQFTVTDRQPILISTWRNYYNLVSRVNAVLDNIDKADPLVVKNKDRYIGEAKFMRALAYFDLVRIFGDVPMITTNVSVEESYKIGREKADKIYAEVIIKDLLDAEAKLPTKYTGTDVGRATKGAAKSILGKVYLTRKDFVNAEAKLKEVTTLGYALLPNFKDLWNYTVNEHHSEYIFDIEYEEGIGEGSPFTHTFSPSWTALTDLYGIKGGTPSNDGAPTPSVYAAFDPKDVRRSITVNYGITINGTFTPIPTTSIQAAKSFTTKYFTPVASSNDSKANWKVIRYADVLLMLAEAMNENGKTTEALTYLNMVHTRAGLTAYAGLTQADAREKIYLERRLELFLEGQRWFDLVRTGRALTTLQSVGMKSHMTVFPVPLTQIQIMNNKDLFPQNPGY
ncbi:MAG TPA: RagB/SusD family nutrient uptake outer membrane protein [Segetibacter sp.]|nr:RagB/SusD family nutrient uptake outer membrane protein [Segetibacter sp.]